MADEKRTLLGDLKKNIFDKIGQEDITKGDETRYEVDKILNDKYLEKEPIIVVPKRVPSNKLETENDFEEAFNLAISKAYEEQRLPTKYTKEGLAKLAMTLSGDATQTPAMIKSYMDEVASFKDRREGPRNEKIIKGKKAIFFIRKLHPDDMQIRLNFFWRLTALTQAFQRYLYGFHR